jgi:hypothetical protein
MPDALPAPLPIRSVKPVTVTAADGFVVVSSRVDLRSKPPYRHDYDYTPCKTLAEAQERQRDYEAEEYLPWRFVGIFPVKDGMPVALSLDAMSVEELRRVA